MKFWMSRASSWNVVEVVRPQPGQAATSGTKVRNPMVCSSSWPTLTSTVRSPPGSGVSETPGELGIDRDEILHRRHLGGENDAVARQPHLLRALRRGQRRLDHGLAH